MGNPARPAGSKYDLATKVEVEEVREAARLLRREMQRAIDALAAAVSERADVLGMRADVVTARLEQANADWQSDYLRVVARLTALENRTLRARWRRALAAFRGLFRDREAV